MTLHADLESEIYETKILMGSVDASWISDFVNDHSFE